MRIQHNIAALNSYRNLSNNNTAVSKNLEKLSSGYKINRAGDDAAGLAISEKMRAQITGLETAQKNAQDGISLVQTAEGALTEVHSMLNRMVELANQSANGTYQDEVDRENLQKEINSLVDEIDRISKSTNFNGINLLDGTMGAGGSTGSEPLITGSMINDVASEKVAGATNATAEYEIDFAGVKFGKDGTANVKIGNFDLNIEVTKDMTAEDFAAAVAKAINEGPLGAGSSATGAAMFTAGGTDTGSEPADLKFTATANGTKVTIKANGNGVDDVSGLAGGKTKVTITEAKNDGGESSKIEPPSVALDTTNNGKLGNVSFEFAKDATDDIKKAFLEAMETEGFELSITVTTNDKGASNGSLSITGLPDGYTIQYKNADSSFTDVTGNISFGASGTDKINGTAEMEFQIVDSSGKAVGTVKIGALSDNPAGDGTSKITFTPPKTGGSEEVQKSRGASALAESSAGIKKDDQFEMDFSKLTNPTENVTLEIDGITITLSTEGSAGVTSITNVKVGRDINETINNIVAALKADTTNGKALTDKYDISAKDGVITFKAKADDTEGEAPKVGSGSTWEGASAVETKKVEPEAPSEVKKGDKYEMDFSKMEQPKDGETLVIGDITVKFGKDGKASVFAAGKTLNVAIGKDINETMDNVAKALSGDADFSKEWKVTAKDGKLTFEAQKDGAALPKIDSGSTWKDADKITAKPVEDDSTATDAPQLGEGITLQIGDSSAEYNRITVTIGDMSAAALGIEGLDISTQASAMEAIDKIKNAINKVSSTRGDLGAIQNRLEHTINNLSVTTENMTAAESRIRDVDMAKEMMAYTKNNILVQSSQAMLAQANQIPQGVLQLLQ